MMKNKLTTISLISTLSFSVFCFCYLNSSALTIDESPSHQVALTESTIDAESESHEILLPDLRAVESIHQFVIRLFKAL